MMIGEVLRIGYISREKVFTTNAPAPVDGSAGDEIQTAPLVTVESLLELSEQADETTNSDKTRVLADI
jgi:hypothetical protein